MATVPASIGLTSIADGAQAVAADHRNNFTAVQTALNALIAILAGGLSGQGLQSGGGTTVSWAYPPGYEFSYVPFTAAVATTTATEAAPQDVATSAAIVCDGTPIRIEFFAPSVQSNAATTTGLSLWEDGVDRGRLIDFVGAVANWGGVVAREYTPAAGTHTYKIRSWTTGGTNLAVSAGAGGVGARSPGFIRVTKI